MSNHFESMNYIDKKRKFEGELPAALDAKLKEAYVAASMIGPPFYWKKMKGGTYQLRGFPGATLTVSQEGPVWSVVYKTNEATKEVFSALEFDEAFKAAREFAFDNRREFLFSDREAFFKARAASEKQLKLVREAGFTQGIEDLTMGQAGALMDCGVLSKFRKKKLEASSELPF